MARSTSSGWSAGSAAASATSFVAMVCQALISALKAPQVKALAAAGELQLSLFDQRNLAEISSERFPGERLVVCRNPDLAAERARKREDLLLATEKELAKVKAMVDGERGRLRNADAGRIGERVGRIINKHKVAKHFDLEIADQSFSHARKTAQIAAEAALDGLYVLRTTCPKTSSGRPRSSGPTSSSKSPNAPSGR